MKATFWTFRIRDMILLLSLVLSLILDCGLVGFVGGFVYCSIFYLMPEP